MPHPDYDKHEPAGHGSAGDDTFIGCAIVLSIIVGVVLGILWSIDLAGGW